MSKDNLITKFRDAMGFMATHASPIGGYLSSKVRQGLNNYLSKRVEEINNKINNTYYLSPGLQILNDFIHSEPGDLLRGQAQGINHIAGLPITPIRSINSEDLAYSLYPGVPKNIVRNIFSEVDKNRLPPKNSGYTNSFSRNPGIGERLKDINHKEVIEYEPWNPNFQNALYTRLPHNKTSIPLLNVDKPSIVAGYDGGYSKPRHTIERENNNYPLFVDKQLMRTGIPGRELVRQHELGHAVDEILNNKEAIYSTGLDEDLDGLQYKPWISRALLNDSHLDNPREALNGISSLARGLRAKAYAEGKDYSPSSQYQRDEFKRIINMNDDQFGSWFNQNKHYFKNPDPILRFRANFRDIKADNPNTTNLNVLDKFQNLFRSKKNKKPEKSYEDAILNTLPYVAKNNQANRGLKYANFKKFKSFCT